MRDNKAAHNKQRKGKAPCTFCGAPDVKMSTKKYLIPVYRANGIGQVTRLVYGCSDRCFSMQREMMGYEDERIDIHRFQRTAKEQRLDELMRAFA